MSDTTLIGRFGAAGGRAIRVSLNSPTVVAVTERAVPQP
jgi:hypothetical protein